MCLICLLLPYQNILLSVHLSSWDKSKSQDHSTSCWHLAESSTPSFLLLVESAVFDVLVVFWSDDRHSGVLRGDMRPVESSFDLDVLLF